MGLLFAFFSAFLAAMSIILSKKILSHKLFYSNLFIKNLFMLIFIFLTVLIIHQKIYLSSTKELFLLIICGIINGFIWITYYRALVIGNINKVIPIEKLSIIITIILSGIFIKEKISIFQINSIIIMTIGIILINIDCKSKSQNYKWLALAIISAFLNSFLTILCKLALNNTSIYTIIAFRCTVGLIMMALFSIKNERKNYKDLIDKKHFILIIITSFITFLAWIFYLIALNSGPINSIYAIEKLNVGIIFIINAIIYKKRLVKREIIGISLLIMGIILLIINSFI